MFNHFNKYKAMKQNETLKEYESLTQGQLFAHLVSNQLSRSLAGMNASLHYLSREIEDKSSCEVCSYLIKSGFNDPIPGFLDPYLEKYLESRDAYFTYLEITLINFIEDYCHILQQLGYDDYPNNRITNNSDESFLSWTSKYSVKIDLFMSSEDYVIHFFNNKL